MCGSPRRAGGTESGNSRNLFHRRDRAGFTVPAPKCFVLPPKCGITPNGGLLESRASDLLGEECNPYKVTFGFFYVLMSSGEL